MKYPLASDPRDNVLDAPACRDIDLLWIQKTKERLLPSRSTLIIVDWIVPALIPRLHQTTLVNQCYDSSISFLSREEIYLMSSCLGALRLIT